MGQVGRPAGYPKTGGRAKGVKNKPNPIKELLSEFVQDKMEDMVELWDRLENREKISLFIAMLKYVVPPAAPAVEDTEEESTIRATINQLNALKKSG